MSGDDMASNSAAGTASQARAADHGSAGPGRAGAQRWFGDFAHAVARLSGRPLTFCVAVLVVTVWAVTGPLFNFSDTWQLVINTGTTIITFLMVFLIQSTQNRDTLALQIKLSELVLAMKGAKNDLAVAEDLTEDELERLHAHYAEKADTALATLTERRGNKRKPVTRNRRQGTH
jgi:low affinity Fe/Cu permease